MISSSFLFLIIFILIIIIVSTVIIVINNYPNKPDPNKPDPNKHDPNKHDPNKPDPNKPDPNKPDPNKPDPNKPDPIITVLDPTVQNIKKIFDDAGITDIQIIASRCGGNNTGINTPSDIPKIWEGYNIDDFWNSINIVTKINTPLYLGQNNIEGAVILSGMLAQFLEEAYNFQICDESVWNQNCYGGNCSCGQFGNNYTTGSGYTVLPVCDLDTSMNISASNNKNNSKWTTGSMECTSGTSTEGCCWWGRGPTQLTGRHNMKMFENWLHDNSNIVGTLSTSICSNPGILCEINKKTNKNISVVWLGSLFYWITSVQNVQEYKPQLNKFMQLQQNGRFASKTTDDLILDTPASWPSGIGGAVNNSVWSNLASNNSDRICHFLRIMRLLNLMDQESNNKGPYCGINPVLMPLPSHNCCSFDNSFCSTSTWCNKSEENCNTCGGGKWLQ